MGALVPEVVRSGRRGLLDRVADGVRTAWFGPGEPPRVIAPPGTLPRQWDYPTSINTWTTPRSHEGINFQLLRALADNCILLRLGLETCKIRATRAKYTVQPIEPNGSDQGVREITQFLRRPDARLPFVQWAKLALEELYVLDALACTADRTRSRAPMALQILAGDTITPKIDATGRTPLEGVAYQQITKGGTSTDFTRDQLVYWMQNPRANKLYGCSAVEQLHIIANLCIRVDLAELLEFTDGTIPPLLIGLPESMNKEDRKDFAAWWASQYEGNAAARHQAMFVPMGDKMQLHELADRKFNLERHEWLARLVTYALNLPPSWAVRVMNRATAEQLADTASEEGDLPRCEDFAAFLTECVHRFWGYTHLQVVPEDKRKSDPLKEAQADEIWIRSGVKSPDESREKLGLPTDGVQCGRIMMTTAGPVLLEAIVEPLDEDGTVVDGELVTPPGEAVQDSALNGAQITGLLDILTALSDGVLTPEAAVATIRVAFPTIDEEEARRIVAGVEERETPEPDPNAPPPTGQGDGGDEPIEDDGDPDDGTGKEGEGLGAAKAAGLRKRRPTVATLSARNRKLRASRLLAAKATRTAERVTARRVARALKAVMRDVVTQVAPALGKLRKDEADRARELTALLDLAGFDVLIDPTAETLAQIAETGARTAIATVTAVAGTAESIELDNAPVVAFTRARAAELVGKRVLDDGTIVDNPNPQWAITDGTRELVRGTITQAFEEQWSRDQLIDALEESYAFSTQRATTIARTEITRALVDGNVEGWRQSGVVEGKSWILGSEHDDDDECDQATADGVIPLEAVFSNGMHSPPAHPRCVCDLLPSLTEARA